MRTPIHPGEVLSEELSTLGISASLLAREIKVPTNRVTHILNGTRSVTADTAIRLGLFFGTSPDFWLNLQKMYDLDKAYLELGGLRDVIKPHVSADSAESSAPDRL